MDNHVDIRVDMILPSHLASLQLKIAYTAIHYTAGIVHRLISSVLVFAHPRRQYTFDRRRGSEMTKEQ